MDHRYAREKLTLLLRDLDRYDDGEFWRQMGRIASGATDQPSPESLQVEREIMADALDHIRRTAQRSRTQTKRLRFIAKRASLALQCEEFTPDAVELPREVESPNLPAMERQLRFANRRIRELEAMQGAEATDHDR